MDVGSKRKAAGDVILLQEEDASKNQGDAKGGKAPRRVDEDRVAALPVGANLIECEGKSCTHEVAWPPELQGSLLPPPAATGPPAREFPFKIDPFQQAAVNALEAGHSVLVAAHTSAGKTVVAEYAFAMALRDKTRVVYTSPLKALSNQKYRELKEEFGDVGLMTGDVTINPEASCLVMTTEILRSMLYRGSEVVREVQLLVYDEIHYLRDKERGVVWEESIILAPKSCRFAFLSATIPNAKEFALWIAKTHGSPCHVVYTDYRPTPLQHYIFPTGGDALYMVVDERGMFREDNFQKAVAVVHDAVPDGGKGKGKGKDKGAGGDGKNESSDIFKIVKMILERNYDPVIVFSFSKKECEKLALSMAALDLTDEDEKHLTNRIWKSAIECLSLEDQKLPQIANIVHMLKRGIGVHHSGLLPIVKEAIEILFQEGLLKVLVATETFSTGLNMPAKTVVFTNARKFDGTGFRWVSSGEYIQMSGRAGRRGLDDRGIVILMLDAKMESAVAKEMIKGAPDVMYSEFHLGYNMLLNIMRLEGGEPEHLMKCSFKQFQVERSLPQLEAKAEMLQARCDAMEVADEEQVQSYLVLLERYVQLQAELRALIVAPKHSLPFLQPGRLVRVLPEPPSQVLPSFTDFTDEEVAAAGVAFGNKAVGGLAAVANGGTWGTIVSMERQGKKDGTAKDEADGSGKKGAAKYIVDVLVNTEGEGPLLAPSALPGSTGGHRLRLLAPKVKRGVPQVVTVPLPQVDCLSSVRVYIQKDLRPLEARQAGVKCVGEAVARLTEKQGQVPLLDPRDDMKIDDRQASKLVSKLEGIERQLADHPLASSPDLRAGLAALQQKQSLEEQAKAARREVREGKSLIMRDDLKHMQRVLRRLGHVDSQGIVTLKGKVAACISSGNELVLTELIFNGAFVDMSLQQLLAACSCFVCQEKMEPGQAVSEEMNRVLATVQESARRVAKTLLECKIEVDEEEFVGSFHPTLMEAVAAWYRGDRFADLLKSTKVFEGAITRVIRRLEELLRQLHEAMKSIGDVQLAEKFEVAGQKIKRDVIFAASLYL